MTTLFPRVLSFIDQLPTQKTTAASWALFRAFASQYGFTCGAVADLPDGKGDFAEKVLCMDWPKEWAQRYLAENYVATDPAVLHMNRSLKPYTWADMLECPDYDKAQRNIVSEASEFSLTNGLLVPLPALRADNAVLAVAGKDLDLSPTDRAEIHMAAINLHSHLRGIVRAQADRPDRNLSPRERECLQWAALGKSDWDVGEILSISRNTVNIHIQNAKTKFGVPSRIQAIILALREGIISA